jgi:hypothetical protein
LATHGNGCGTGGIASRDGLTVGEDQTKAREGDVAGK